MIWPENWPAWKLFGELSTQWLRAGMDGAACGLNYSILFARLERMRLDEQRYESLFNDIRHMEREALRAMRESN